MWPFGGKLFLPICPKCFTIMTLLFTLTIVTFDQCVPTGFLPKRPVPVVPPIGSTVSRGEECKSNRFPRQKKTILEKELGQLLFKKQIFFGRLCIMKYNRMQMQNHAANYFIFGEGGGVRTHHAPSNDHHPISHSKGQKKKVIATRERRLHCSSNLTFSMQQKQFFEIAEAIFLSFYFFFVPTACWAVSLSFSLGQNRVSAHLFANLAESRKGRKKAL